MMGERIDRYRLKLADMIRPRTHRLIEVEDVSKGLDIAQIDLISGGDALSRGWECHPTILYNGAEAIKTLRRRVETLAAALDEIRELNMEEPDRNGHRWARSDLIEQAIVFAALPEKLRGEA
jgi:hypothetical protein